MARYRSNADVIVPEALLVVRNREWDGSGPRRRMRARTVGRTCRLTMHDQGMSEHMAERDRVRELLDAVLAEYDDEGAVERMAETVFSSTFRSEERRVGKEDGVGCGADEKHEE